MFLEANPRHETLRGPPLKVAWMTEETFRAFNLRPKEISPEARDFRKKSRVFHGGGDSERPLRLPHTGRFKRPLFGRNWSQREIEDGQSSDL